MSPKARDRILNIAFWVISVSAVVTIGWKFMGSQDQPMETKILTVFLCFLFCAFAFRWIRKRTGDARLGRLTNEAIEWSDTGISAVFLAFLIMAFLLQAFKIPSGSMQPTLKIGDHLFVNKFIYGTQIPFTLKRLWNLRAVKRNDVIVFLCPPYALSEEEREAGVKKDFIKRAVGLPGDEIAIRDKILYVNGERVYDPHGTLSHPSIYKKPDLWKSRKDYERSWRAGEFGGLPIEAVRDNFGPITIPPESYFVMGDNRDGSFDSRFWGPLPARFLKGKAWLVYWPFRRFKVIH